MVWSLCALARHVRRVNGIASSKKVSYGKTLLHTSLSSASTKTVSSVAMVVGAPTAMWCVMTTVDNDVTDNHRKDFSEAFQIVSNPMTTYCENTPKVAKLERKKTALRVAASLQRMNTKEQLSTLKVMKDEMLQRWEKDEEGWRKLPARAWPQYQPNPQQLEGIVEEIHKLGCHQQVLQEEEEDDNNTENDKTQISHCTKLLFDMATSLVFYNVDPPAGLALYEKLAKQGHADSMVACGIVLVEGLGVPPRELEGFAWLEKAIEAGEDSGSLAAAQAMYELGTVYYTGVDGVVEEDPEKAFELFERASKYEHTAALYMVADCLVEGEGTERSVAKAVPLFYKAAERGHRYSRQRIRELLARVDYPL